MNYNPYFVLIITLPMFYFFIFKVKNDRLLKAIGIIISIGAILASIGTILEGKYPSHETLIENIFVVPIFVLIITMFILLFIKGWKLRNNPESKALVYVGFGTFILTIVVVIVLVILIQLGVFD
ncbi:hypothetical protein TEPIDINF_001336 [Tepidibacillus infernus]|uniref:hypothetical protein n=1 Tax=Tepidibacillus infernus TaxID=1806172 RepID=UPI003B741CD2